MSYLKEALKRKEQELSNIVENVKASLAGAPKGQLKISHCGKSIQFYCRSKEKDDSSQTEKYIRKDNQKLAYQLAQRDYDEKLMEIAEQELKSVQKLLKKI